MVCLAKPNREYHDLIAAIDEIVEIAIERNCDVVIGRVAAEMSRQSKQLYRLLDDKSPLDDSGEWIYDADPLWLTWVLYGALFALGCGASWLWGMWM